MAYDYEVETTAKEIFEEKENITLDEILSKIRFLVDNILMEEGEGYDTMQSLGGNDI